MGTHDIEQPAPEDFELSDLEDAAFIPNERGTDRRGGERKASILTSWMPPRARMFVSNLSKIKVMIIILALFMGLLVSLKWLNGKIRPVSIPAVSRALSEVLAKSYANTSLSDYVLKYAPVVFMDDDETYFPSDLGVHVSKTRPMVNFVPVKVGALGPDNLDALNQVKQANGKDGNGEAADVYLASIESLANLPSYLKGRMPGRKTLMTKHAISSVIIVVEKPEGIVDAFYMYFYSFNKGPTVMGNEVGNHLGDWEHNMVRFRNGEPESIWYSQHDYGEAFTFGAVQKIAGRPVCYSAIGSHANYAVKGKHDLADGNELIPRRIVYDHTSCGRLWDPTLSAWYYTYAPSTSTITPIAPLPVEDDPQSQSESPSQPHSQREQIPLPPTSYLTFSGYWGDQEYTDDMPDQRSFRGFHKWTGGPQGPLFKHLDRADVCWPGRPECIIKSSI